MKLTLCTILFCLLAAIPAKADSLPPGESYFPLETFNFDLFVLPVADNSPDLLNLGLFDPDQSELPGTFGFTFTSDPFTMTDGELSFIPGSYDDGNLVITDPDGTDTFTLYGGAFTFEVPASFIPSTDPNDAFLWLYGVPGTVYGVPEPATWLLMLCGLGVIALGARRRLRQ